MVVRWERGVGGGAVRPGLVSIGIEFGSEVGEGGGGGVSEIWFSISQGY